VKGSKYIKQPSTTSYRTRIHVNNGRRRDSSAPPGIEFVFYAILGGCILLAAAIAYYVARLLRKLLKVAIGPTEIVVIAAIFLLAFTASSLVLQQREDGVTVGFYGNPTIYEGAFLYYGFPAVWYRMFEPYDPSFKHMFTTPGITNFGSFFIDLAFWLTISVTLTICVKFLVTKRSSQTTTQTLKPLLLPTMLQEAETP